MSNKLTQQEFAKLGAKATNTKYSPEQRREWARKGVDALKAKYGPDYFKERGRRMGKANKKVKEPQIEANLPT